MSRRRNYQRNAKDKGYASRLHDGFDIDIDYVFGTIQIHHQVKEVKMHHYVSTIIYPPFK